MNGNEAELVQGQVGELVLHAAGIKCLQCCGEFLIARASGVPEDQRPPINDAVTFAPAWQSNIHMGQTLIACIALPSCMDHLESREKSAEERATEGGIILGRDGMGLQGG